VVVVIVVVGRAARGTSIHSLRYCKKVTKRAFWNSEA
jgi:hypothetical protein